MAFVNKSGPYPFVLGIRLDDDEKGVSQIDTLGGYQKMTTCNQATR